MRIADFTFLKRLCLGAGMALAAFPSLPVQAGEALVNSRVEVDVSGKDASDARAQALAKGEVDALMTLLGKLTTPEQVQDILRNLDAPKISAMVRGTEVVEERITSNRYRATLVVTFDGDEISNLISGGAKTGAAGQEQHVTVGSFLVLPVYEEAGATMLWEDENPWRAAWKATGLEVASGDIIVPFGDNEDAAIVNAKTAASANYAALAPMTIRYGVSDIVILQAKFTPLPDMVLSVVKRRINRLQNEVNLLTYRADLQETKDVLLARAAADIASTLEHRKTEELQEVRTVQGGDRNRVMMLVSVSTLASWTQVRSKLSSLPMVDRLELLAISPQQIDMIVHYRGTPDSLSNAINAQNLRLAKNPTYWVVSRD